MYTKRLIKLLRPLKIAKNCRNKNKEAIKFGEIKTGKTHNALLFRKSTLDLWGRVESLPA